MTNDTTTTTTTTDSTSTTAAPMIGCHVDGSLGQYAGAAMVLVAESFGYSDAGVISLARKHYDAMQYRASVGLTDDQHEELSWSLDDVESWLNDNVAAAGHAFGWHDGELFYEPLSWWED